MESVKSALEGIASKQHFWIAEVFVVVLVTLILAVVVRRFLDKLYQRAQSTRNLWDDALCESALRPAKWFIWLLGLSYAASIVAVHSESAIFATVEVFRRVGTIAVLTWFLVSFISLVEKNLMDPAYARKPLDKTTAMAIGKLLRISVVITALLVGLQSLGYNIAGILAFGGIGGIAVGFAAKDMLANFFGGLMIYLDRPFAVGDWVRSPDRNIEGTVEDIGWRLTRVRTFDKRPLYIPNSTFAQVSVENPSRMLNRRISETVGIRYDDARRMRAIVTDVRQMIETHPDIDAEQTIIVNFNAFATSSLDIMVYCFTKTTHWVEYHQVKQNIMLNIIDIVEGHGAQCAFPTSTIHIPDGIDLQQLPATTEP